jgi:hypothetical protein
MKSGKKKKKKKKKMNSVVSLCVTGITHCLWVNERLAMLLFDIAMTCLKKGGERNKE